MTEADRPQSWDGRGCPDSEWLAGLLVGGPTAEERRRLADHVVGCPRCAADFRLLRELDLEARKRRTSWSGRAWAGAIAATVLLAVASGFLVMRQAPDVVRGPGVDTRPADGATLQAAPEELAWPAQPGARSYSVRLFRGEGTLLWESPATLEPSLALPDDVRALIAPGESAFWTVEIEGRVPRRRLGPFWFEIRSRQD
jgi:hypothetical protein